MFDSISEAVRSKVLAEDRRDQRRARAVLGRVASGYLSRRDLAVVATVGRLKRKPLADVTVRDLIEMGLIHVEDAPSHRVGPMGESQPVSDHSSDPLVPPVKEARNV